MSGIDVQISIANLTQMDRHQNDINKAPAVNQEKNTLIALQESAKRVTMPVEPDQAEGKNIDPEDKKRENLPKGKKKKRTKKADSIKQSLSRSNSGYFVDVEA